MSVLVVNLLFLVAHFVFSHADSHLFVVDSSFAVPLTKLLLKGCKEVEMSNLCDDEEKPSSFTISLHCVTDSCCCLTLMSLFF